MNLTTNIITKENLTGFGNLLRSNKEIKKLRIYDNKMNEFENKKEFCLYILDLLNSNKVLQITVLKNKGYYGEVNPNIKNYIDSKIIEEIKIEVFEKPEVKEDPSNWSLD